MVITAGIRVAVGSTIRWIAFSGASREEEGRAGRGSLMPFRARISPSFAVCSNYFRANGLYHSPAPGVNKEPIFIMGFSKYSASYWRPNQNGSHRSLQRRLKGTRDVFEARDLKVDFFFIKDARLKCLWIDARRHLFRRKESSGHALGEKVIVDVSVRSVPLAIR